MTDRPPATGAVLALIRHRGRITVEELVMGLGAAGWRCRDAIDALDALLDSREVKLVAGEVMLTRGPES
jgi:hypothetical protein